MPHSDTDTGDFFAPEQIPLDHLTMDHGVAYSVGWVNHWAICGLREAADAAEALGHMDDAQTWRAEAVDLQASLKSYAQNHPAFFGYERTTNSLLWPTQV